MLHNQNVINQSHIAHVLCVYNTQMMLISLIEFNNFYQR